MKKGSIIEYHHCVLIFYQLLMNECNRFWTWLPPVEISCNCYRSKLL